MEPQLKKLRTSYQASLTKHQQIENDLELAFREKFHNLKFGTDQRAFVQFLHENEDIEIKSLQKFVYYYLYLIYQEGLFTLPRNSKLSQKYCARFDQLKRTY